MRSLRALQKRDMRSQYRNPKARFLDASLGLTLSLVPHLFALAIFVWHRPAGRLHLRESRWPLILMVGGALLMTVVAAINRNSELTWDILGPLQLVLLVGAGYLWTGNRESSMITYGIIAALIVYSLVPIWAPPQNEFLSLGPIALHENTWAARGVVALALVCVFSRSKVPVIIAGVLSITIVLLTESRTAGATVLLLLTLQWVPTRFRRNATVGLLFLVLTGNAVLLIGGAWRQVTVDTIRPNSSVNLVPASEHLDASTWHSDGIEVESLPGMSPAGYSAFRVTLSGDQAAARPTTRVSLDANAVFLLSFLVRQEAVAVPGFRIWTSASGGRPESVLDVLVASGTVTTRERGDLIKVTSSLSQQDSWHHVNVAFAVSAPVPLNAYIGPVPGFSGARGASAIFSHIQLSKCSDVTCEEVQYTPTSRQSESWTAAISRLSAVGIALDGFFDSPWLGNGIGVYLPSQESRAFQFAHAHNLLAQTLHDLGILGGIGLLAFLTGLYWGINNSYSGKVLLLGILLLNISDLTFWNGGVTAPALIALGAVTSRNLELGSVHVAGTQPNKCID